MSQTATMPKTTIRVSESTWKRLNALQGPGDTFDDAMGEALDRFEETDEVADPLPEPVGSDGTNIDLIESTADRLDEAASGTWNAKVVTVLDTIDA